MVNAAVSRRPAGAVDLDCLVPAGAERRGQAVKIDCLVPAGAERRGQAVRLTALTSQQTYATVIAAMDINDRLAVIDASGGVVSTWDRPPIAEINAIWFNP